MTFTDHGHLRSYPFCMGLRSPEQLPSSARPSLVHLSFTFPCRWIHLAGNLSGTMAKAGLVKLLNALLFQTPGIGKIISQARQVFLVATPTCAVCQI